MKKEEMRKKMRGEKAYENSLPKRLSADYDMKRKPLTDIDLNSAYPSAMTALHDTDWNTMDR